MPAATQEVVDRMIERLRHVDVDDTNLVSKAFRMLVNVLTF